MGFLAVEYKVIFGTRFKFPLGMLACSIVEAV